MEDKGERNRIGELDKYRGVRVERIDGRLIAVEYTASAVSNSHIKLDTIQIGVAPAPWEEDYQPAEYWTVPDSIAELVEQRALLNKIKQFP